MNYVARVAADISWLAIGERQPPAGACAISLANIKTVERACFRSLPRCVIISARVRPLRRRAGGTPTPALHTTNGSYWLAHRRQVALSCPHLTQFAWPILWIQLSRSLSNRRRSSGSLSAARVVSARQQPRARSRHSSPLLVQRPKFSSFRRIRPTICLMPSGRNLIRRPCP